MDAERSQNSMIKLVQTKEEHDEAFFVRDTVLTKELGFDIASLYDDIDKVAKNVLYYSIEKDLDGNETKKPAGTLRFFFYNGVIKIGRVAVLKECRGQQVGKKMMLFVEDEVWNKPEYSHINQIALSSIHDKMQFYIKLGYKVVGDAYLEEGVPHIYLVKDRPQ